MEKLNLKYKDLIRAIKTFKAILDEPYSLIVRDASIQRFEYTFEIFWKFIREYLKEKEGLIVNSPKKCFRELFAVGMINEADTILLLEITDKRNDTVHTYKEYIAEKIYEELPVYYHKICEVIKVLDTDIL